MSTPFDEKPQPAVSHPMLTAIWQRGLPRLRDRLAELDRAALASMDGGLTPEEREAAAQTAHQLAGSLGMFGYNDGTDKARAIEVLLEADGSIDGATLRKLTEALRLSLNLS